MPELIFYRRGDEVLKLALERNRVVLGRGESSDVVLPDPEVSRQHVAVALEGAQYFLEDLSGRGTVLCGKPVQRAPLEDGVDITLGQWRAIFRERSGGDDAPNSTIAGAPRTDGTAMVSAVQPKAEAWQPAQVRVTQGFKTQTHRLAAESFTVGKDTGNDLVLEDRFISSRHVKVTRKENAFQVLDLGSTNGTFIGPMRIREIEVPFFTALRVGETELVLEPAGHGGKSDAPFLGIIGSDPAMKNLIELIERVAPSVAAVSVFGESGTGKELVANALHTRSNRADGPFIPINCAAISKELIESELFGHEKGAFTGAQNARKGAFEEADGGTLFLDEIGELPLELQAKLLRVLESGEIKRVGSSKPTNVDVRVVAATHRDLMAMSREGKFREDLYYRLCVIPLHLPPLRNRRDDMLTLANHFVEKFSPRGQRVALMPDSIERLRAHAWPGNVRELRNVVHRALLLRKGPNITADDLTFDRERNVETGISVPELPPGMTLEQMMMKLERQIVEQSLRRYGNNRERVARELGVARSTLFKRLKEWGLTRQDEQE